MRNWIIAAILIMALVITTTIVVSAARTNTKMKQQSQYGMGPGMGQGKDCMMMGTERMHMMMAKQLGLTQDQMAQIKTLRDQFMTETQSARDQIKTGMNDMVDLWSANPPDAAAIKAKAADIEALKAQVRDTGIDYIMKGMDVLTPAQRDKLRTMIKDMSSKWMEKGGMCMGCCMGISECCPKGKGAGMGRGMGTGCPMKK